MTSMLSMISKRNRDLRERAENILKLLYPEKSFGKLCFIYCGEACYCEMSIPYPAWDLAYKQAEKELETTDVTF